MEDLSYQQARILIVDDEQTNVRLLERLLNQAGYTQICSTTDPREVLPIYLSQHPDLILLDLHMPHFDGFEVMSLLRGLIAVEDYLPILVLTADISSSVRQRALSSGANDFLTKPLDAIEVLLRIKNLLQTRFLHVQLQGQKRMLEEKVYERTHELEEARIEILKRLALAAEYRDDNTGQHTQRVGRTSALLASLLGLSTKEVHKIRRAAPLHDVGKIGISDNILLKPGKLTREEFELMKAHTTIGARILGGGQVPLLQMAEEIALTHHERWDGLGYPHGLAGEAIPLVGRIVAVADVFDALTHARPYKAALPREAAIAEIERNSGTQFDPQVVEAFTRLAYSDELGDVDEADEAPGLTLAAQGGLQQSAVQQQLGELRPDTLPAGEREMLQHLAEGLNDSEIAKTLGITVGAARKSLDSLYHKLGVNDRNTAVARALELGLIQLRHD